MDLNLAFSHDLSYVHVYFVGVKNSGGKEGENEISNAQVNKTL